VELLDALRTTGAIRDFLDEPVDDALVYRILDVARFAPNGGNRQAWHVVVVRDAAARVALRDLYVDGWYGYLAMLEAGLTPYSPVNDPAAEAAARAKAGDIRARGGIPSEFAEHYDRVPVLLAVLAQLRNLSALDRDLGRYTLVGGASIYPFAWNVLLAAREHGLAGTFTTVPILREPAIKEVLGVPGDVAVALLLALGRPARSFPKHLTRRPVEEFATVDRYDGPPLTAG
jgi:nitroreductase